VRSQAPPARFAARLADSNQGLIEMQSTPKQGTDDSHSVADKLIFVLFAFGVIFCVGLGVWALFFKA
jgi:hypothetical protein